MIFTPDLAFAVFEVVAAVTDGDPRRSPPERLLPDRGLLLLPLLLVAVAAAEEDVVKVEAGVAVFPRSDGWLWLILEATWAARFSFASSSRVPERGGDCMPEVGVETGVDPATWMGSTGTGASCGSGTGYRASAIDEDDPGAKGMETAS